MRSDRRVHRIFDMRGYFMTRWEGELIPWYDTSGGNGGDVPTVSYVDRRVSDKEWNVVSGD